jgi:hypothetical protein
MKFPSAARTKAFVLRFPGEAVVRVALYVMTESWSWWIGEVKKAPYDRPWGRVRSNEIG